MQLIRSESKKYVRENQKKIYQAYVSKVKKIKENQKKEGQ